MLLATGYWGVSSTAEAGYVAANGWEFKAPLRVHPRNPRWFTDDGSRTVYLSGMYQWHNLHDCNYSHSDWATDLNRAKTHKYNFIRLWVTESTLAVASKCRPTIFKRTGPGNALDGQLKYNVGQINPDYLQRLKERVSAARSAGVYVSIMLFQGFNVAQKDPSFPGGNPWVYHPFNRSNNVNGINGDVNGDGQGYESHTLLSSGVIARQDAYVKQVISAVNGYENVIFEISNESHGASTQWQYHMIDLIKRTELTMAKQHPVLMSFQWDKASGTKGTNQNLIDSESEAMAPTTSSLDPPIFAGSKVTLLDTDHLMSMPAKWGTGTDGAWAWKLFTRGMNLAYLDVSPSSAATTNSLRALGLVNQYARRMSLAYATPSNSSTMCSTRFCLYYAGKQYLVFQPGSGAFQVNLAAGTYRLEWLNPKTGQKISGGTIAAAAGMRNFTPPFQGPAVLFAYR